MAKKISQLTQITNIDASTYVPVVQGVGAAADDYKMLPSDFYKTETNARIAGDNNNYTTLHAEILSEQSDRIASDDDIKSDIKDLQSIFKYPNTETYFIFVGDSRTDDEKPGGYPTTMTPYPNILMGLPNFLNKGVKVNAAVWGEDIQQAFDGYPSRVYPYRPNGTTIKEAYLFFMIGINDLAFGNDLLPTIQNKIDRFIEYCTRATNDGFKVIALTSFYTDYLTSQKEADRIKFNNAIINNAHNVFLTVDTDMLMGKDTTSIFWADVLHQSHSGSRLIADYINAQFSPGNKLLSYRAAPQLPHEIKVVNGHLLFNSLINFPNNQAAITGGLTVGMVYHTDGVLKIVI